METESRPCYFFMCLYPPEIRICDECDDCRYKKAGGTWETCEYGRMSKWNKWLRTSEEERK